LKPIHPAESQWIITRIQRFPGIIWIGIKRTYRKLVLVLQFQVIFVAGITSNQDQENYYYRKLILFHCFSILEVTSKINL
jgi:hypothetical protein